MADLVLIPVQPSGYDLWGVSDLAAVIQARQDVTGGKPAAAFVVSRQIPGTYLAREIDEAAQTRGIPVLAARTSQRVAYVEAGQAGLTVLDRPPHSKAAHEINTLTDEILTLLNHV